MLHALISDAVCFSLEAIEGKKYLQVTSIIKSDQAIK
jgi:hypothetical protein